MHLQILIRSYKSLPPVSRASPRVLPQAVVQNECIKFHQLACKSITTSAQLDGRGIGVNAPKARGEPVGFSHLLSRYGMFERDTTTTDQPEQLQVSCLAQGRVWKLFLEYRTLCSHPAVQIFTTLSNLELLALSL